MDSTTLLHNAGLKATPSRRSLLEALAHTKQPLTASELLAKLASPRPDLATLYRALKEFVEAGIVRQVDFQHGHAHFELEKPDDHHHHVICKKCEKVEDVQELSLKIPKLKNFTILNHSLEFYGLCQNCNS